MQSTIKQPGAFLPLVCSFIALAVVISHIVLFGTGRQPDEGAAAHIWQILMVIQLPLIVFFVIKYLPRRPKQTLLVLVCQIGALLLACAPVFFLRL